MPANPRVDAKFVWKQGSGEYALANAHVIGDTRMNGWDSNGELLEQRECNTIVGAVIGKQGDAENLSVLRVHSRNIKHRVNDAIDLPPLFGPPRMRVWSSSGSSSSQAS